MVNSILFYNAKMLINLSRWRFWLYLAGPYLVGYTIGIDNPEQLLNWWFWLHLLFFLFPANLLLYGVNDIFDTDTDAINPKKGSVEHKLLNNEKPIISNAVIFMLVLSIIMILIQKNIYNSVMIAVFVLLSIAYSTPPVRLKARPFFDSASNVLYAVPGFLGYQHASGQIVPFKWIIIAALWTAAMHLYSAIPDIESDIKARLNTTATFLGFKGSLILCTFLWLAFALCIIYTLHYNIFTFALLIYPIIPAVLIFQKKETTAKVYWYFPIINTIIGMAAFFVVILNK
ncbi:MAG: prenyltransferase [Armatimonadota bacterium]